MAYQNNFTGIPFKVLLDKGHKQYGLAGVNTEILQFPAEENGMMAIFRAVVKNTEGQEYSGHGDADPNNTTSAIAPHLLRMAETRAIARALRWLTNSGETAHVEISGDEDESDPSSPQQPPPEEPPAGFKPDQPNAPLPPEPPDAGEPPDLSQANPNEIAYAKTQFLIACENFIKKIDDEDQVAIALTICGYDNIGEVKPTAYRRVYDELKEKHTEIEEKRAAIKLASS